jgi:hypothetical protein
MKEKWLHVFTLDKTQKVKETTVDKDESGNEVQITKEVEKKIPQRFCILKPTRKIQDDSSIFYSVKVSEAIKLGLITKAFLLRKFQKDGVIASDEEKKEYTNNYSRAVMLEVEAEKIKNDSTLSEAEKDLKVANINDEYKSLRQKIFDYESIQNSLFDNTAEKRAADLLNLWFVLHLLYSGEENSETCIFGDGTFDQRMERLNQIEDSEDSFLTEAVEKGAFLIGQLNSGVSKEDLVS